MHVDDVRQTAQLMDQRQCAAPLHASLEAHDEENGDPEEDDVVDAGFDRLHQIGETHVCRRP